MLQVCTMDGCCVFRRCCFFASFLPCWQCRCASSTCFHYDSLIRSFKFAFVLHPRLCQAKVCGNARANFGEKPTRDPRKRNSHFPLLGVLKATLLNLSHFLLLNQFSRNLTSTKQKTLLPTSLRLFLLKSIGLARLSKPCRPACTQDFE